MQFRLVFPIAAVCFSGAAFAQNGEAGTQAPTASQPDTYTPRMGEQPVFGKKYMPNEPRSDFLLEVNPLLLLQRGIGIEGEARVGEKLSLGAELVFHGGEVFSESGVSATSSYAGGGVKFRMYPLASLTGMFFGGKLSIGGDNSAIEKGNESVKRSTVGIAPTAHVGYRVTNFGGFTLSMYVGGGVNLVKHEISAGQLSDGRSAAFASDPAVAKARTQVNKQHGMFRFDYGLTLGVAF